MPSVVIVSDSHGLTTELIDIAKQQQADCFIHCGDSELEAYSKELESYIKVGGNCDSDSAYPNDQIVDVEGLNILVTHGHLYNVKMGLRDVSYRAEEAGAQVVCFGHTHVAGAERLGDQLFINPGSIRLPKKLAFPTYARLDWKTLEDVCVSFFTMEGKKVDALTYQTSFA